MSTAEKLVSDDVSLHDIAKECWKQAKGDRERAQVIMRERIRRHPHLLDHLIEPLLDRAVTTSVNSIVRSTRAACERTIASDDARGLIAIANNERRRWLDYPLSTGRKLGDATKFNLTDEADMHAALARGNLVKVKFYRAIAQRIGTKRVRDAMNEDQIASIWTKASDRASIRTKASA